MPQRDRETERQMEGRREDSRDLASLIEFFRVVGSLKHLPRKGWVLRGVDRPETVASHMYRMAIMSFFIQDDRIDRTR